MKPVIKYTFVALLLLASPFSYAGTWYSFNGYVGSDPSSVAQSWCSNANSCSNLCDGGQSINSTQTRFYYNYWSNYPNADGYDNCQNADPYYDIYVTLTGGTCPAEIPYEWSDGTCNATPEQDPYTCSSGKTMFVEVTKDSNGNFPDALCVPQSNGDTDYCMVGRVSGPVITDSPTMNLVYATAAESPISCDTPDDVGDIVRFPFTPDSFTGEITEQDTFFSETSNTYSPPQSVCTSNGDGTDTCVTITSVTESVMSGQGTTTTSDGNSVTQTTDSGTTLTKSEVTETIDDGNGTVQKTTTTTNTAQSGSQTQQVINANDGSSSTTIIKPAGQQLTTQQTTVETTHPDGTVTTSSNSTTKTADGQTVDPSPDATTEGNCGAPGQPDCVVTLGDESVLQDPTDTIGAMQTGLFALFDNTTSDIDVIDDTDDGLFELPSINFYSGNTCDPTAFGSDYHGASFFPFEGFCSFYDSDMRPILEWSLYLLTILGVWRVYTNTIAKGA